MKYEKRASRRLNLISIMQIYIHPNLQCTLFEKKESKALIPDLEEHHASTVYYLVS